MASLSPAALAAIKTATILVGGPRHLAHIPEKEYSGERWLWPNPIHHIFDSLESRRGEHVCVLASGDPMDYGVGALMAARFGGDDMVVYPAPGAFSFACARLGWARHETETFSLHGRPFALLNAHLRPDAKLLILCNDGTMPMEIAAFLTSHGFGASPMTAFSHLGGSQEERRDGLAAEWSSQPCPDLVTVAIDCRAGSDCRPLMRSGGLPDDAFRHDGQLTKQAVRAATLAALCPLPRCLLWDVGAGCGSIAIEWLRAEPTSQAIAIERNPQRCGLITDNAQALGVPSLRLEQAVAPDILHDLPQPDVVFIGGGLSGDNGPAIIETCWRALPPGGRLVANAITQTSLSRLEQFALSTPHARYRFLKLAWSHGRLVNEAVLWEDKYPLSQMIADKVALDAPSLQRPSH